MGTTCHEEDERKVRVETLRLPSQISEPEEDVEKPTEATPLIPNRPRSLSLVDKKRTFWFKTKILMLICLLPFGGHFVKASMSSLQSFFVSDPRSHITNTQYGVLVSIVSIPNLVIPFVGGVVIDKYGLRGLVWFLGLALLGQIGFALALSHEDYWLALLARLVFGAGEGSAVVGQRALIALFFGHEEITFAIGFAVAFTNLSRMLAKATVAPVALYYDDYIYALWYGALWCGFSYLSARMLVRQAKKWKKMMKRQMKNNRHKGKSKIKKWWHKRRHKIAEKQSALKHWDWNKLSGLTSMFWLLVISHALFVNVFHLFYNHSAKYLMEKYHYQVVLAGYVTSITSLMCIFAPLVGLLVDRVGGGMHIMLTSSIFAVIVYGLLLFTEVSPALIMLLMSACMTVTPTIMMAFLALSVDQEDVGIAFGISEVLTALGAFVGNIVMGYLRDVSGSYDSAIYFLLSMAVLCLVLVVAIIIYDVSHTGYITATTPKILESPMVVGMDRQQSFCMTDGSYHCHHQQQHHHHHQEETEGNSNEEETVLEGTLQPKGKRHSSKFKGFFVSPAQQGGRFAACKVRGKCCFEENCSFPSIEQDAKDAELEEGKHNLIPKPDKSENSPGNCSSPGGSTEEHVSEFFDGKPVDESQVLNVAKWSWRS